MVVMKRSQNGFSLLEVLTVIIISTAVVIPLMRTLYGNFELNDRVQSRRDATSIADGSIYAMQKIDIDIFIDPVNGLLTTTNGNGTYYIELHGGTTTFGSNDFTCDFDISGLIDTADEEICEAIFSTIWNNLSLDWTEFKIYMFDYALTTTQYNSLVGNGSIELEAREAIQTDEDILATLDQPSITGLIRVVVWIDYYDDPDLEITLTGLIADE